MDSLESCLALRPTLEKLVSSQIIDQALASFGDSGALVAPFLYQCLQHSPYFHTAAKALRAKQFMTATELSLHVLGTVDLTTITALLSLLATARQSLESLPLLPHRLHLQARAPGGVQVCLNRSCSQPDRPDGPRYPGNGPLLSPCGERCPYCNGPTWTLVRCLDCGEALLAADRSSKSQRLTAIRMGGVAPKDRMYLSAGDKLCYSLESESVSNAKSAGERAVHFSPVKSCPNCGGKDLEPLRSKPGLFQSMVAETVYSQIPPLSIKGQIKSSQLPGEGRRLLVFSDSRAGAARLGPQLRQQHERQLVRSLLARTLAESGFQGAQDIENDLADLRKLPQQPVIAKMIAEKEEALKLQSGGQKVEDICTILSKHPTAMQIFEPEKAQEHEVDKWAPGTLKSNQESVLNNQLVLRKLAYELAQPLRKSFLLLESCGLAEVVYPQLDEVQLPGALLGTMPEDQAQLLQTNWTNLLAALLDTVRLDNAVSVGSENLNREFRIGQTSLGDWVGRSEFTGKTDRHRRRTFVANLFGQESAEAILGAAFDALFSKGAQAGELGSYSIGHGLGWLEANPKGLHSDQPCIRVFLPRLQVRRPVQLFHCAISGRLWPRQVAQSAPYQGSHGTLAPISHTDADRLSGYQRVRSELQSGELFSQGLWAEEHSAQLGPSEARRLQELFRSGMRNLLSCTTTLELGIDIGGLSATLLANVPPGKANYLQRAGRVGRRSDGSSVVVTFCRHQPYDQEVFSRFGDFLARPLRKPTVFLHRQRIAERQLHAWLLGEFFSLFYRPDEHTGAMSAYGKMGSFCGVQSVAKTAAGKKPDLIAPVVPVPPDAVPTWWRDDTKCLFSAFQDWVNHVKLHREGYQEALDHIFGDTKLPLWEPAFDHCLQMLDQILHGKATGIEDDGWVTTYQGLLKQWQATKEMAVANALYYRLEALAEMTVIETLGDRQFLPSYGFPIGLQKLRVHDPNLRPGEVSEDRYRLERSGLLALREYVPGSSLMAAGKVITSHGLLKHWSGTNLDEAFGLRAEGGTCRNGHFHYNLAGSLGDCPTCGESVAGRPKKLLFPRYGYTTAQWDPPNLHRDIDLIGKVDQASATFAGGQDDPTPPEVSQAPKLRFRYQSAGEIVAYNEGSKDHGFAICLHCGYADSEIGPDDKLPKGFKGHLRPSDARACSSDVSALRNERLAAWERTDCVLIEWDQLIGPNPPKALVATLGEALRLAGAELLELDSREIALMITPAVKSKTSKPLAAKAHPGQTQQISTPVQQSFTSGAGWATLIYDNVPGGAAHVYELMTMTRQWLEAARKVLFRSEEHHRRCDTACLDCILSYAIQEQLTETLQRRQAYQVLEQLLDDR